jgi:hypothetical protein
VQSRPIRSGSRNGPGEGLSRLWEITSEVADASKAPSPKLGDEYINTLATIIPSSEILGPITRSRAQQLNHQVNSFLCSSAYNIESQLLPIDLIILRNQGEDH